MTIDHVGVVVESLEASATYYIRHFGLRRVSGPIVDALQDVELQFLEDDRGQRIELVRPVSARSPVARALAAGGGVNHICYQVADLAAAMESLVGDGAKTVRQPLPAVAFNGRRVAFLYTRQRELVELVEAESA